MGHQVTNALQKGKEKRMPCFLPSISPLPPQLKKRSQPHSMILVSVHTCIGYAAELRLLLQRL